MLYGHGDDLYNAGKEVRINFSSNVWYGANLRDLKSHLYAHFEHLNHYPEPDASSLRSLLAHQYAIDEQNIVVTNGSITAFYLIAQAWQHAKSIIRIPSFAEYEDACRLYNHQLTFFSTAERLKDAPIQGHDLCWLCNPNNPDGTLHSRDALMELITSYPETIFVIDQAYGEFTEEKLLNLSDVKKYKNLILIQSISKEHNIPGFRIGYLVASTAITERINRLLIPWSVNTIAIESGKYVLTYPEQFLLPLQEWRTETLRFIEQLQTIEELEVLPTSVTFFLVRLKQGKAADLKRYLIDNWGILIRDASNFRGLDETYFRLSTQRPEENEQLIHGLKEWFGYK